MVLVWGEGGGVGLVGVGVEVGVVVEAGVVDVEVEDRWVIVEKMRK